MIKTFLYKSSLRRFLITRCLTHRFNASTSSIINLQFNVDRLLVSPKTFQTKCFSDLHRQSAPASIVSPDSRAMNLGTLFKTNYSQLDIDDYFKRNVKSLEEEEIGLIFKCCGTNPERLQIVDHIPKIIEFIHTIFPSVEQITSFNVCLMIFGLGSVSRSDQTEDFYRLLPLLATKLLESKNLPHPNEIAMAISGLKNVTSDRIEVQMLLNALCEVLQSQDGYFFPRSVAISLFGLNSMNSDCMEVRELLKALVPMIEKCAEPFDSKNVANSLYGLTFMKSANEEVRELLKALIPKIESCSESLTVQEVGKALKGLKSMNSDDDEVRELLRVLKPKIKSCAGILTVNEVADSLDILKKMKGCEEVREIIKAIEDSMGTITTVSFHSTNGSTSTTDENVLKGVKTQKAKNIRKTGPSSSSSSAAAGTTSSKVKAPLTEAFPSSKISSISSVPKAVKVPRVSNPLKRKTPLKTNYTQLEINDYFEKQTKDFNHIDLAIIFRNCGESCKQNYENKLKITKHISTVLKFMQLSSSLGQLTSTSVCNMIYGLQSVPIYQQSDDFFALLSLLTTKLLDVKDNCEIVGLSMVISTLPYVAKDRMEFRIFLVSLSVIIQSWNKDFSGWAISNSLLSLKLLNSDCLEVRQFLKVLIPKIESCTEPLVAIGVGMSLAGLQNMSSDHVVVLQLVKALIPKIASCCEPLSIKHVVMALSGIKNISSTNREVRELLKVLKPKIETCRDKKASENDIQKCLDSLKKMRDCEEVRDIIQILNDKFILPTPTDADVNKSSSSNDVLSVVTLNSTEEEEEEEGSNKLIVKEAMPGTRVVTKSWSKIVSPSTATPISTATTPTNTTTTTTKKVTTTTVTTTIVTTNTTSHA